MSLPQISIILPVRDGARFVEGAIQSALASQQPTRELIIVDDGSTDASSELIGAASRRDARIVALQQHQLGIVAALEHGLNRARAPLVARLDADDLAYPERFARQVEAFSRNPKLALLGAAVDKIDEAGRIIGRVAYPTSSNELKRELWLHNPFVHSVVMFRADAAREVGGYRNFFEAAEDYDLWFRLSERWEIGNLEECLGALRVHDNTVTRRNRTRQDLSAVLVRRCATARQSNRSEPILNVQSASSDSADLKFDAAEVRFLQALEFADMKTFLNRFPDRQQVAELVSPPTRNREERKLAQHALFNLLSHGQFPEGVSRASLAAALVRIDPWRAVRLALGSRRQN